MKTLAERVRHARKAAGFTKVSELARRIGVTPQAIYLIENGSTRELKARTAVRFAHELGVSADWLTRGLGPGPEQTVPSLEVDNASYASEDVRQLPVISYVQAGGWTDVSDPYPRGQGMEAITVDAELAQRLPRSAFALKIEGDSMVSSSGDSFYPGEVIIVDTETSVRPGDYVVAKLDAEGKATFKRYRDRGTAADGTPCFELVPLNPDYATIVVNAENPGRIIGVMVEHRRGRRR